MTRVHLREEPGAGKPHARICEGESQMAELLDRDRRTATVTRKRRSSPRYKVQTSKTLIGIAATRLMLSRLAA